MKKVYMIHGFNGNPDRNWFPWLAKELKKHNIDVDVLSMPTPRYPIKEEWVKTIIKSVNIPTEDIYLIGHSLGSSTILRYLETLSKNEKIGGAVLVSGPINYVSGPEDRYDLLNKFLEDSFDFNHINSVCKKFIVIHGTDDPIVSFSNAEELSKNLSCELIPILNGKHLNDKSGVVELPEALDSLLKIIK
jgi:hypothetical protein